MDLSTQSVEWRVTPDGLVPFVSGREITWAPQAGSQEVFLNCPITEVLYEGERGPGKTDALLMSFYMEVGKGYGAEWRGIIFRRTYPELQDLIEKSQKWFKRLCPGAKYNQSEHVWTFPEGEKLYLRHFERDSDYWKYHGHNYTFIGWEELCTWATDSGLRQMYSTLRSTRVGIPLKVRCTANPYGVGHNWVKTRYCLPVFNPRNGHMVGRVLRDENGTRVAIHGRLGENKILLHSQPNYIQNLRAAAKNEAQLKAWLHGDWNIVAGGMFDDVWNEKYLVLPNFPLEQTPRGWRINRSYDHGKSKPFSVGWWAESNGERFEWNGILYAPVRGDLIRIAEWYGWNGKPNEGLDMLSQDIGRGIAEREEKMGLRGRVHAGPADSSIFDDYEPGKSVAGEMRKHNIYWEPADKGKGSRKQGWDQMRKLMRNAVPGEEGVREEPGMFILERCQQFRRTIPVLSRDDKDLDDIDTESEDHIADEARYRVRERNRIVKQGDF